MNKELWNDESQNEQKAFMKSNSRKKDWLVICLLACLLMFAVWQVFNSDKKQNEHTVFNQSESEKKITQILSQMDGVGEVDVMIGETENCVSGVVVVCEGANNLRVVMDIREAICVALGINSNDIKIYLKN